MTTKLTLELIEIINRTTMVYESTRPQECSGRHFVSLFAWFITRRLSMHALNKMDKIVYLNLIN
ncbi:hypothetical protein BpHYR1_031274 [Brachionus plicatilis]|uniref:Uncharacterized protein n=1 Tax=Brachionus plicatilis TaxID=10195 RepID=A0A3M7R818_BRAPC|nr:hypothetical protein BpHYR1_031274 [Brachionus plicatilis]